ncbi:MAG: SRPBCC family protein [Myxococcaceae bacterium]|nr:SRPBCC family protein [Myxococcaceae bacterium]
MKRVLKIVGLGLVALVAVFVVVGLFLPRQWRVEQTLLIDAEPEHLHPLVSDLKEWQSWAAWNKEMDPQVKWEYGGPASGEGAWWSWSGPQMGHGKMTITKSDVASGVWVDEMIETDKEVNARGSITWTRQGQGLQVKWVDEGTLPPVIGGYFVGMIEKMLSEHFQTGLKNLKAAAEKRQATAQEAARAAQAAPPEAAPVAEPATP